MPSDIFTRDTVPQLRENRAAFDSVASDYDGSCGSDSPIQDMREEMWRWLDRTFAQPSCLLDLGCGTGVDAVRMAGAGHQILATDWSPQMIEQTNDRARREGVTERLQSSVVGAHELDSLTDDAGYDGVYSDLGPLNCVPDLQTVSRNCARLLKPGGALVFCVMGRVCPWEIAYYLAQAKWARVKIRFAPEVVAVGMNKRTVWTRYYTPREFYRSFAAEFILEHYRGLCVFVPPPYMTSVKESHMRWYERLWRIDRQTAAWPVLRSMGDHFLIVMRKR
jgi:ubiquinone/menaquinone biosynthesis C-methylase UbiE